jgi:hypothetical protein
VSAAVKWEKLPALPGRGNPCACCPPIPAKLGLRDEIAVGFGDAHVERDGEVVWREPSGGPPPCEMCDGRGAIEGEDNTLRTCLACSGFGFLGGTTVMWTTAQAEKVAKADPDHDWRIVLYGPLHGEVYQRHAPGEWVLVEKNKGFA